MTKKIIISLAVIARCRAWAFYMGKACFLSIRASTPPASLAVLVLEKPPKAAPAVGFADAAGARHALEAFRGRYVLLNLWATWCAPCVNELPSLARLARLAPGLRVLAVDWRRRKPDAAAPSSKAMMPARCRPIVTIPSAVMRGASSAYGLPMTVLIDPEGKVVARAEGPAEWGAPEAVAYFKRVTGT